jgi:molybdenum cofactor guanylyltransferase
VRVSEQDFIGIVLAGGQSSRMKQDKALLSLKGETLIARCERVLFEAGAKQVWISRNQSGTNYLPDEIPGFGPLSGIHAAVSSTPLPVLVMPVDMPLVEANLLQDLVSAGFTMENTVHYQEHALPAFIYNNYEVRNYLNTCLTKGGNKKSYSMTRFLSSMNAAQLRIKGTDSVRAKEEAKLINTNTPEQWQHVLDQQHVVVLDDYRKRQ